LFHLGIRMPSRLSLVLILGFWLSVTGYVIHRDVWPRLYGDAPPAIRIDLSDEATQTVPARWIIYRGDQQIGILNTRMEYVAEDNTFRFVSTYKNLQFDVNALQFLIRFEIPDLVTTMTVSRNGELRGQTMAGELIGRLLAGPVEVHKVRATASAAGIVRDGQLVGQLSVQSPLGDLDQPLEPVPVPGGQVLNPLQPVNRLRDVRPGQRWVVHEVNPLFDAMADFGQSLLKERVGTQLAGFNLRSGSRPLVARVLDQPELLPPSTQKIGMTRLAVQSQEPPAECWVIEYRGDHGTAKTWVRVSDGKVMRQEASGQGETLRLERED
jgi:hypothetical protein